MHGLFASALIVVISSILLGCAPVQDTPLDTREADEAAIRAADIAWARTGETKDLDAQMRFYMDDPVPVMMPPNAPLASGKEAIRHALAAHYERPDFSVTWRPARVELARSGDLAYAIGVWESTMNDATGQPRADRGKYVEIWKKQADGAWKVAIDIFNSDLPAAPPGPPSEGE